MALDKMEKAPHYLIYEDITGGTARRHVEMEIHVREFKPAAPKFPPKIIPEKQKTRESLHCKTYFHKTEAGWTKFN